MTTEIKRDDAVCGPKNVRQAGRVALKKFQEDYPGVSIESFSVWKDSAEDEEYQYRIKARA